ncbi:MAG TPA: PIN domain-containing protein [Verrucomicrobiae bacterium]|mgnify:CR=1 FL=1|nr:PIN domain-containing protein [Verrucomicrobiae bacterium]
MSAGEVPAPYFLDTNVFVYASEPAAARKSRMARDLIRRALAERAGRVSTQVVQEFLNVALHKFAVPMGVEEAREYLSVTLWPLCRVYPSEGLYETALGVRAETGYHFFDALIVAAALETGCRSLLSEDLQHGREFRGLRIMDPFR